MMTGGISSPGDPTHTNGSAPTNSALPTAKNSPSPTDREKLRRVIQQRELCGLANDTKWNELVTAIRTREDWRPRYRYKCIDGPLSDWDAEWFHHLPFPLISVEWLDLEFIQETRRGRLIPPATMDHSPWMEQLLRRAGLDYRKGNTMIRVFGYSPRSYDLFDDKSAT